MCIFICEAKMQLWLNAFPYISYLKGMTLVWFLTCVLNHSFNQMSICDPNDKPDKKNILTSDIQRISGLLAERRYPAIS